MVRILFILMVLFHTIAPIGAEVDHKYLAVFSTPGFERFWKIEPVDYRVTARDWSQLDQFLMYTAMHAHGREVILDIDVHGDENGLYLQWMERYGSMSFVESRRATVGYLFSKIDQYFPQGNVTVLLEACYAGRAYKNTIRNNLPVPGDAVADYVSTPAYPVWGVGNETSNFGNHIYLQYKYPDQRMFFEDMRNYEFKPLAAKHDVDSGLTQIVYMHWKAIQMHNSF